MALMQQQDKYEPIIYNLSRSQDIRQPKNYFLVFISSSIIVGILILFALWHFYLQPRNSTPTVVTTEPPDTKTTVAVTPTASPTPLPAATPAPTPLIIEATPAPTPPIVKATPEPRIKKGRLTLNSTPEHADVVIQGIVIGQTPLQDYELEPGTYTVTFAYNGQTFRQKLTITAGHATEYTHHFQGFASLKITTTSSGCDVTINGKPVGRSPLLVEGLSPGTYAIVVSKIGYHTTEKKVTIEKGEHQEVFITIKRLGTKRQPTTADPSRPLHPSERLQR